MKILSIDTSGEELIVVADMDGTLFASRAVTGLKKHNAAVLESIDGVLRDCGAQLSDFDAFAAVVGAGSFTGVRVGVATVNAFSSALLKPLIAVTSFECVPSELSERNVFVEAGHGNFYFGRFENGLLSDCGFCTADELFGFGNRVFKTRADAAALAAAARAKAVRGELKTQLEPLYLRKSQAEREADGD